MVALSRPGLKTNVLLFGPHFLSFNQECLNHLRSTLLGTDENQWIIDAVETLPGQWKAVLKSIPELQAEVEGLEDLKTWLQTNRFPQTAFPLPNVLLAPLVVITQLTQYTKYLELAQAELQSGSDDSTEAVGFCIGLLSALVVSSSQNQEQFRKYGANAIRLAMLIGALVDAQNTTDNVHGESQSFSIAWSIVESEDDMMRIVDRFSEAYISVIYDERRATITTSKKTAPLLLEELEAAGITIKDVPLQGRFHCRCYEDKLDALVQFCDSTPDFQFPNASELALPTRSNSGGEYIKSGNLHHVALRSILVEQSKWYQTFFAVQSSRLKDERSVVISFGLDRCIPPTLMRKLGPRVLNMADVLSTSPNQFPKLLASGHQRYGREFSDNDIAVVGMACKVPGADDLEEFWKILCEGKSQHVEVPSDRFSFETAWRTADPKRKWFGNFLRDIDAFDHKFFKKTPRELASMDPQHRLMLQIAYQAVEQSGYFQSTNKDKDIGVYIGVSNVDYQDNIACHQANAFSATGNLMSFVAGKISHYFGWTGPGLSIDTACSGSAVAIHHACKAILSGDCTAALAGGVNTITSPLWYQNLAGASFLSPTGPCKPFDVKGDGYCRGEGCGAVFLKKMSSAIADGDQIFGVIASTAVKQNQNCTAITVPNADSLSDLFRKVTYQAKIEPKNVSVIEAHGTGTAVGDPAEYESIRQVFGGPQRSTTLSLGSVKGLIGHTECGSGIVALIKMLLMVHQGAIPPQVSFDTINPALNASAADKIEIVTHLKPWDAPFKAALINNYGASGSNASMLITEGPNHSGHMGTKPTIRSAVKKHPFWFSGFDDQNLIAYSNRFIQFLRSKIVSTQNISLSNLSFNNSRQSNRSLNRALIFSCNSIQELEEKLLAFASGFDTVSPIPRLAQRPIVLCFGGQISTFIGLDREVFDGVKILRNHLDQCHAVCQSLGLTGIYPEIFQRSPVKDPIILQTMLFAIQWSCAKTWIECGIEISAVVGHSFGELTALCISGVLSLEDTLRMIAGRARIIRDYWGSDRGSMMAVEANIEDVEKLLADSSEACPEERAATIACFNGPRSFTLAGSAKAIEAVSETLKKNTVFSSTMRTKKLNVSNAFHSTLVEPLMADLAKLGEDLKLTFEKPTISFHRSTQSESLDKLTPKYVAEHMRNPVYFNHAIQRLSKKYPSCIWLEAGSNSTITTMASRALNSPRTSHFQPIDITSDNSLQHLTDATTALWKQGVSVNFWPHHPIQTSEYSALLLPPYQFEKSRHWLDLKVPATAETGQSAKIDSHEEPKGLWTFIGWQDSEQCSARFRINTMLKKFEDFVSGHTVAHAAPLCPSTLQLEIVIEALTSLRPDYSSSNFHPQLQGLENHVPICIDSSRLVWLDVEISDPNSHVWNWKMVSNSSQNNSNATLNVSGKIVFLPEDEALCEFTRYERLVKHQRCLRLLESNDADEILKGRNIYKAFADVVDYGEVYRGVRQVVGKNMESAGRVVKAYSEETWLDTPLCDSFCQVAGIFVNCMTDRSDKDVCISNKIEGLIRSPKIHKGDSLPESFDVFAFHNHPSDKSWISDVFVFDPRNGTLLGVILGIHYQRVSKLALGKLLSRLTSGARSEQIENPSLPRTKEILPSVESSKPAKPLAPKQNGSRQPDISSQVRNLLANVSGLESNDIKDNTGLVDMGVDSLLGMELAREIETVFNCTLDTSELMLLTDFRSLIKCIESALGPTTNSMSSEEDMQVTPIDDSEDSKSDYIQTRGTGDGSVVRNLENGELETKNQTADFAARQAVVDHYIRTHSEDFRPPVQSNSSLISPNDCCVIVTGATGSLGSHLVAYLAALPDVKVVICLNRLSNTNAQLRQRQAFESRGISLSERTHSKLKVLESDTGKALLGLSEEDYEFLVNTATHIVHNAWPMTIKRPVKSFEPQFRVMRNLIDLSRSISCRRPSGFKVGFEFISSIATVGLYPLWSGKSLVPEESMAVESALPSGYSDAKLVCERMLDETLSKHTECFHSMVARIGQIAGSSNGYWNPAEHLSFLIKSSQTLNALPNFQGDLSWLPVNDVAATLSEVLLSKATPYPVYHVENPARQPWSEMISAFSTELDIPRSNIIPFGEWLDRVRNHAGSEHDNPAKKILEFFDDHFLRMACGGLVLDTRNSREHSRTLASAQCVDGKAVERYVEAWRGMGLLK